jgi:AraC-like DNA-binding protein
MGRRILSRNHFPYLAFGEKQHWHIGQSSANPALPPARMKLSRPLAVTMPSTGVIFAESAHAGDFRMAPRTDPFHKLLYVLRGGIRYSEAGRMPENISAGMLLVVPAGVEHQISDEEPSTLFLLCLGTTFLAKEPELPALWRELTGRAERHIALSRPTQHQVESSWRRAMLERLQPRIGGPTTIRALAAQILVTLVRLPAIKSSRAPLSRVAAVAREMEVTFYDAWNLDRAATRAGVSRRHFSMLFRKVCGRTFLDHLTDLRLTHAMQLLKKGDHSVTGVVFACGFGDVSQFYRLFRGRFRLPPRQWVIRSRSPAQPKCQSPGVRPRLGL